MTRTMIMAGVLIGALSGAAPASAGDASGFDPTLIDQCLDAAETEGEMIDCATADQQRCLHYVAENHPDLDRIDREFGCLDAEAQAWEAKLQSTYDALRAVEAERGRDRHSALTKLERDWITFRDSRCAYDKITNGHGTGGILAEPLCRLREAARQTALLITYSADRE